MLWKNGWSAGWNNTKPPPTRSGCSPLKIYSIILVLNGSCDDLYLPVHVFIILYVQNLASVWRKAAAPSYTRGEYHNFFKQRGAVNLLQTAPHRNRRIDNRMYKNLYKATILVLLVNKNKQCIWWCGVSLGNVVAHLVARQTSGAKVPDSNPASPTIILGRCRIIV